MSRRWTAATSPRRSWRCARTADARRDAADPDAAARGPASTPPICCTRVVVEPPRIDEPPRADVTPSTGSRARSSPKCAATGELRPDDRCLGSPTSSPTIVPRRSARRRTVAERSRRCRASGADARRRRRRGLSDAAPTVSPTHFARWRDGPSALADGMRFDFLYDRRRRIFSIGYRLADADGPGRLDSSFYDLLASEARLASFVAIAKGDVPQHHWFHLGRMVTSVDGHATLMSWGGTMFEYLMPQLLLRSYPGHAARPELPRERPPADRVRQGAPRALGHLRVGLCLHRSRRQLSVQGVRRAGPRAQARAGGRTGDRAVRHRAGRPDRSGRGGLEPRAAHARRGSTGDSGSTKSIDYRPRTPAGDDRVSRRRTAGNRACVLRAPSGHVARGARQRPARRHLRDALPRRPAGAGDRAAAAGAGPARGDPLGSRARPKATAAAPATGVIAIPALPNAAHDEPAHALPVERPLHRRAHARRRRLRARGAACRSRAGARTARPTPARISSTCAIRGRATSGRPATSRCAASRRIRGRPSSSRRRRSGGATATSRRSSRSSSRRKTTSRCGGCRSPTAATGRGRSRSRATRRWSWRAPKTISRIPRSASSSSRPSTTRRAPACCSAAGRGRPTSRAPGPSTSSAIDGRLGGAVEWETDRARFLGRGRSPANPPAPRRPGALRHDRRRARSRGGAPRAGAPRAGRVRARDVCHGRRAGSRDRHSRWCASTATRAPPRGRSRWHSTHVHITLQHLGLTDDQRHALRSAGLAGVRLGRVVHESRGPRAQRVRTVESVGLRHLGRPADRARPCDRCRAPSRSSGSCCTRRSTGGSRICAPTW